MQYFTSELSGFLDSENVYVKIFFIINISFIFFSTIYFNGISKIVSTVKFLSLVVSGARNANWHLSLGDTQLACSPIIATVSSYAAVQISLCYEAINKLRVWIL